MPRTFSLAGLLLALTLAGILCALTANRSEKAQAYALTVASLTPAAVVCLSAVSFSRRRKATLALTLIGAVVGAYWGLLPALFGGPAMTLYEAIELVFIPMAIYSTLASLLTGCTALAFDRAFRSP
jgi:hypothetical protein